MVSSCSQRATERRIQSMGLKFNTETQSLEGAAMLEGFERASWDIKNVLEPSLLQGLSATVTGNLCLAT